MPPTRGEVCAVFFIKMHRLPAVNHAPADEREQTRRILVNGMYARIV